MRSHRPLHGADPAECAELVDKGAVVGTAERRVAVALVLRRELLVLGVHGGVVHVVLVAARAVALVCAAGVQEKADGDAADGAFHLVRTARCGLAGQEVAGVHGDAERGLRPFAVEYGLSGEARGGGEHVAQNKAVSGDLAGLA